MRNSFVSEKFPLSTLIAKRFPRDSCFARWTQPKPPLSMVLRMRYLPPISESGAANP